MSVMKEAADGLKYMSELLKNTSEIDQRDAPKGMHKLMASIFEKSKKLAIPALIFTGATAATVTTAATGGAAAAAAVLGICSGTVGLLNSMRKIYQGNKKSAKNHTEKSENEDRLTFVFEEKAEEFSNQLNQIEKSIQSNLKDMNLSVLSLQMIIEKLDQKMDKIILQQDSNIDALFQNIQSKIQENCYNSASDYLNGLNFVEIHLQSHVGEEKAREMILSAGGKKESLEMFYCFLERRQKLEALIQLQRFLNDMKESSTSAMDYYLEYGFKDYLRDLEGYWRIMKKVFEIDLPTILVLGKCGAGKSTLCNIIAGLAEDAGDGAEGFKTSAETLACTQQTTIEESCFFGNATKPLQIIDTPGFDDPTKNHDAVIISNLVEVLKNEVENVNLVLITLNGQCPRLDGSLLAMLKIIRDIFSPNIWDNMAVVFTRMPMDSASVNRRCKKDSNHDANVANGFINAIREQFNPPETGKSLQYIYMDACFNDNVAEEQTAMEECKKKIWGMIEVNKAFATNYVENALTEWASLKEEMQKKESQLSELGRQLRQFEQKEFERIRRENEETRTPVNGLTFLRLKHQSSHEEYISDYSKFIDKLFHKTGHPLKSSKWFCAILKQSEDEADTEIGFLKDNADELCTEKLLNQIPRREKKEKVSQMVFALEISNYTDHFLTDLDIHMVEGNAHPIFVWDIDTDAKMAKPTVFKEHNTFFIAPYAKERLIFRNYGQHNKNKLIGNITMNIKGTMPRSKVEKKMIINFKIDGRKYISGNTKFHVSLTDDASKTASSFSQLIKKKKTPKIEFEKMLFTKNDPKRMHNPCQNLRFPSDPVPGEFSLNSCFGNACASRSMVIISKTKAS